MALYGQMRNSAFAVATPGMRALLAARPREQKGAARVEPTDAQRLEKGNQLRQKRVNKIAKGKKTYQPK